MAANFSLAALLTACSPLAVPSVSHALQPARFVGALDQWADAGDARVRPIAVVEDSRCPINANCVHAGTVRLRILVEEQGRQRETEIGLGKPVPLNEGWLHFVAACPNRVAPTAPSAAQYRFSFVVAPSAEAQAADADCS